MAAKLTQRHIFYYKRVRRTGGQKSPVFDATTIEAITSIIYKKTIILIMGFQYVLLRWPKLLNVISL